MSLPSVSLGRPHPTFDFHKILFSNGKDAPSVCICHKLEEMVNFLSYGNLSLCALPLRILFRLRFRQVIFPDRGEHLDCDRIKKDLRTVLDITQDTPTVAWSRAEGFITDRQED